MTHQRRLQRRGPTQRALGRDSDLGKNSCNLGPGSSHAGARSQILGHVTRWFGGQTFAPLEQARSSARNSRVRAEGLEPPRLAPPAPKAGVSASSTTPARTAARPLAPHVSSATLWLTNPPATSSSTAPIATRPRRRRRRRR